VVGDGDTVGIAAEVADDLLGPAEGALCINNPILTKQRSEEGCKAFRFIQMLDRSGTSQQLLLKSTPEPSDKLSSKYFAESLNGQEERVSRVNPPFPVRRDPAASNHAVDVRMITIVERLTAAQLMWRFVPKCFPDTS
jgi:hypothetical protein